MAEANSRIITVSWPDHKQDEPSKVLLRIERSDPDQPFDFVLLATEDHSVYSASVNYDDIEGLRHQKTKMAKETWEDVVRWCFFEEQAKSRTSRKLLSELAMIASIEGTTMALSIQQCVKIGDMTEDVEVGRVTLREDSEKIDQISIFDWAAHIASDAQAVRRQVQELELELQKERKEVENLKSQLRSFVAEKQRHESELLEKLRHILNSKKLKIRDQQRLLATADVDKTAATKISASRGSEKPQRSTFNRRNGTSKRKVTKAKPTIKSTTGSDEDRGRGNTSDDESGRKADSDQRSTDIYDNDSDGGFEEVVDMPDRSRSRNLSEHTKKPHHNPNSKANESSSYQVTTDDGLQTQQTRNALHEETTDEEL